MIHSDEHRVVLAVCRRSDAARLRRIGFETVPAKRFGPSVVLMHSNADADAVFGLLCCSVGGMTLLARIAEQGDDPAELIVCDGLRGVYVAVDENENAVGYHEETAKMTREVVAGAKVALGLPPGTLISTLRAPLAGAPAFHQR
jgi:hypothetical protein